MSSPELIAPLVRHGGAGADIAVVEGVMGLFDGASGRGELASTAHVAKLLNAPVLLVVDASSMARSAAAIVHGYRTFDPDVDIAGVIFNRVGSDHHEELLRDAVAALGVPVLGALRRDERIVAPERHLGLVPAVERTERANAALPALAEAITRYVDLEAVDGLARAAPDDAGPAWSSQTDVAAPVRIAIARGPAFSFHYEENLELLRAAGAELLAFDPTADEVLPHGADALVLAGGFPEIFGTELEANAPMREAVRAFARDGRPILAECGGLLYLARELDGHAMCDVLPIRGHMGTRLWLGYREARATTATPWLDAGATLRGHEFHYSVAEPDGPELPAAWSLTARGTTRPDGAVTGGVQAGYLHVHWAAFPEVASGFVRAAAMSRAAA